MSRCSICKRRTINAQLLPGWLWNHMLWRWLGGRMDCGGDCGDCMTEIEEWMRETPPPPR